MGKLILFFLFFGLVFGQDCRCPESCTQERCKFPQLKARDFCNCCDICLGVEGDVCGGRLGKRCAISGHKYGFECMKDDITDENSYGECKCKRPKKGPFCGQDGVTYKTKCDLRLASWIRTQQNQSKLESVYKGECEIAPKLTILPTNVMNKTGGTAYLACEAHGIPTPHISFRKLTVRDGMDEYYEEMPSDRANMAVQIRGGPDKNKISAWVLVDPITEQDEGTYECLASNVQGSISGLGKLQILH